MAKKYKSFDAMLACVFIGMVHYYRKMYIVIRYA